MEAPFKSMNRFTWISITSIFYFLAITGLFHFINTDIDPFTQGISYFAIGSYGWLMSTAFIALGIGGITLTIGFYLSVKTEACSSTGFLLLGLWSVTTILAGIFPVDAVGMSPTVAGTIHNIAGYNFFIIAIATYLISKRLVYDSRWQSIQSKAKWTSISIILASLLLLTLMGPLQSLGIGGISQRIYWLTILVWLLLIVNYNRKLTDNKD